MSIPDMIAIMSNSLASKLSQLEGREQLVTAGTTLFRAGDPVLSLFFVVSGALRLVRTLPHGFQLTLQRAGPGAILAEASLFAENYHCGAGVGRSSRFCKADQCHPTR